MNSPRFLVDEDVPAELVKALRASAPNLEILQVGELGAPPKQTPDPALLLIADATGRVLLTKDRSTMPQHLSDHFAAGHHTAGVILMRNGLSLAVYRDELRLIWGATTADEWIDKTDYLP
jgi:hypothetical protein